MYVYYSEYLKNIFPWTYKIVETNYNSMLNIYKK